MNVKPIEDLHAGIDNLMPVLEAAIKQAESNLKRLRMARDALVFARMEQPLIDAANGNGAEGGTLRDLLNNLPDHKEAENGRQSDEA